VFVFGPWATYTDVNNFTLPLNRNSKDAPLQHCHLDTPPDSGRFPKPFVSQVERILAVGVGLWVFDREAMALSTKRIPFSSSCSHL
jgi:hypothetical protein